MSWQVLQGDCVDVLQTLDAGSVQTCVTSPPYWGLRDYGTATWEGGDSVCDHLGPPKASDKSGLKNDGRPNPGRKEYELDATVPYRDTCGKCGAKRIDSQLGLEPTPEEYVENLVAVFREVRRVLRDDGTVWLNLGDSYSGGHSGQSGMAELGERYAGGGHKDAAAKRSRPPAPGMKPKDLVGIPWRVAFALQADGWWLRSDIIWAKPNPMPESVTDRPTRAHEYIFLLSKSARYFYDADAIREQGQEWAGRAGMFARNGEVAVHVLPGQAAAEHRAEREDRVPAGRNKRSVWEIATKPYSEAHFATFPPKLIEPCILAGTPPKCCGECGAPWERVVERKEGESWHPHEADEEVGQRQVKMGQASWDAYEPPRTVGWEPTCRCQKRCTCVLEGFAGAERDPHCPEHGWEPAAAPSPGESTVLDPFAGAGTTGLVATQHGRDFIGIELNPEYAEMARERIRDDAPLFNHNTELAVKENR